MLEPLGLVLTTSKVAAPEGHDPGFSDFKLGLGCTLELQDWEGS